MIQIAITTVDRPGSYILGTLERLFVSASGMPRVRVVVDGADASFLGRWNDDVRVKIELLSAERAAEQAKLHVIDRCTLTTYRALHGHIEKAGSDRDVGPMILLQDDVDFAPAWLEKAVNAAMHVEADTGSDSFVLALYCPYPYERKPYSVYSRKNFYGNQALYMTCNAVRAMANTLWVGSVGLPSHSDQKMTKCADDLLMRNHFVAQREPYLLTIVPSVVQHIGKQTTGCGLFHESPTFGK